MPYTFISRMPLILTVVFVTVAGCAQDGASGGASQQAGDEMQSATYEDLLTLYDDWRAFQKPPLTDRNRTAELVKIR